MKKDLWAKENIEERQNWWDSMEEWKRYKVLYSYAITQDYSIRERLTDPEEIRYFESVFNEIKKNEEEGKHYIYDMPFDFD